MPLTLVSLLAFDNPVHERFTWTKLAVISGLVIPITILVSTFTNSLGEELGWRGYLRRRLRTTLGWRASTLLIGAVWAVYHLPVILTSGTGVRPAATAVTYFVTAICLSVPFTWFAARARRGSVIIPALLHSSLNAWSQTLVGESAFGMTGLLQGDVADTWILSTEGLGGMVICLLVAAAFWPALTRMDRERVQFERPRPPKERKVEAASTE